MVSYEKRKGAQGVHWYVRYRDPDNNQRKKGGFTRKIDAEAWAAEHITTAINHGTYVDPQDSKTTIGILGEQWLQAHPNWSISYYHTQVASWRTWVAPKWAHRPLKSIRHSEIQEWVNEIAQQRSATIVKRAYYILSGIYDMAMRDNLISNVPTRDIELPRKRKQEIHIYTPTQVKALAEASGEHATLVYMLAVGGLRWGEAVALTVEDINFNNGTVRVNKALKDDTAGIRLEQPKTEKSNRIVYLPHFLLQRLKKEIEGKNETALVFHDHNGEYLQRAETSPHRTSWLKRAMIKANLPVYRPHDLRHTAASIAISSGANIYAVQRMLGHENASTTLNIYADLFEEDANNAAIRINETMQKF